MKMNFANSLDGIDWAAFDADWKEDEHPRGGTENKGQFTSKASTGEAGGETEKPEPEAEHEKEQPAPPGAGEEEGGGEEEEEEGEKKKPATAHLREAGPDREQWPEHIKKLVIPPAWADVRIADDSNADLLATGKDAKGRSQYVYSERFKQSQAALKFARMESLRQEKPLIEQQLTEYRKSPDRRQRDLADCTTLVMKMGVRPGGETDTKADKQAYGATTLQGQHVVEENGQTFLRFTGKKGVALNLPVEDKALAANLRSRAKKAGPDGRLYGDVNAGSLLDFVKQDLDHGGFKTKDFRTLLANDLALKAMKGEKAPKDSKQYKASVKAVATAVSQKLGNTATVCLQSYIHPAVFVPWKSAENVEPVKKGKAKKNVKAKSKVTPKPKEAGALSGAAKAWATRKAAKEQAGAAA